MGKKITIGDGDGILLLDSESEAKNKIIEYLYNAINLSNLRYGMLDNIQKLNFLQENEHYVSPNYKGLNYLLIFANIMGKAYTVLINRKKLSYHKNQLDMKTVFIVKILINTNPNMYAGSIFDGKIIQKNGQSHFLIQDCFCLMGKNLMDMEMGQKMLYLNDIINSNLAQKSCNNFTFKLNKLYNYSELPELIKNIMPKSDIVSNGIIFYPKLSGNSIIHIEKKIDKVDITSTQNEVIESKTYDLICDFNNFLNCRSYSYEKGNIRKVLYICKTDIPDVYNLYNNKNEPKMGIAHIPNLKVSHYCNNNITKNLVKVNCVFYPKFDKWIPLQIVN
jgi:hypothetical protein